jgi:SAM-dependent methyltransferase
MLMCATRWTQQVIRMSVLDNPYLYDVLQAAGAHHVTARLLEGVLSATAGQNVLDIGAGTGNLARVLPPDATYWALDNDPMKMERLQYKVPNAKCLLRSAMDTGMEEASVDWTVCVAVSHHLDDSQLAQVIAEMARITSRRVVFLDALWTGKWGLQRVLWRYDRGFYPRRLAVLLDALREHFDLERVERYKQLHDFFLCVGRPRRSIELRPPTNSAAVGSGSRAEPAPWPRA